MRGVMVNPLSISAEWGCCLMEVNMTKLEELKDKYPSVPSEVYDIEESEEMAEMWLDEFGY